MDDQSPDIAEFSKFYVENVPRLVAFLMARGLTATDAADCVQDTMLAALPPMWATLENPRAWCRAVAYHKACDLQKRRREAPVLDLEGAGNPLISLGSDLDRLEHTDQFLYYLSQLTGDRQREVLAWTYDGATPGEIAAALNLNPSAVRSTLRDARAALRRVRERGARADD